MKSNAKKVRLAAAALVTAAVLWLVPGPALAQNVHIDVTVTTAGGVSEIDFLNSQCPNGKPGCVLMDRNRRDWISWEFDRESAADGWVFTGLYFGNAEKQVGNLKDCTMAAFVLPEGDRVSGHASTAKITSNGKRIQVWDENDQACITHYTLKARNENTGETAESDPIIDNRGRN